MDQQLTDTELFCQVAENAHWRGWMDQQRNRIGRPGEFLESLPPDVRKRLSQMKSDAFMRVRYDAIKWMLHPPDPRYLDFVRKHYESLRESRPCGDG